MSVESCSSVCRWIQEYGVMIAATAAIGVAAYFLLRRWKSAPRESPVVKDYKKDMIYLFQFPRSSTVPSLSPYCLKLETWLRIADIPYKNIGDFQIKSCEGTCPFIEFNGVEYPDSRLAIRDLTKLLHKESLEGHLSDEQSAVSRAIEGMIEPVLIYSTAKYRIPYARKIFSMFKETNAVFAWMFSRFWVKVITERLFAMGIGRHSEEETLWIVQDDLMALSKFLGSKHYFHGEKATRVDATVFGTLALILYIPFDTPTKQFMETKCPNLKAFAERIKNKYWPDWENCTKNYSLDSDWKKRA